MAFHLCSVFSGLETVRHIYVVSRQQKRAQQFQQLSDKVVCLTYQGELPKSDLTIIAVSDDAIMEVSEGLNCEESVVHTAGSVGLEVFRGLEFQHIGFFYPLQTFSLTKQVDWQSIPIFINGSSNEFIEFLTSLAQKITSSVHQIDEDQKVALHLSAVFANNFSNFMFTIAQDILVQNKLSTELIVPLIEETISKLQVMPAVEAQTGPALRQDQSTISKHLARLATHPDWQRLYAYLTQSIQERHQQS